MESRPLPARAALEFVKIAALAGALVCTPALADGPPAPEEAWRSPPAGPVTVTSTRAGARAGGVLPSLEEVLEKARQMAPEVRSGRASLDVSRAGLVGARLAPLPNPTTEITATPYASGGTTQGTPWNAAFWIPFELSGQRGKRIQEAEAYVEMHQQGLEMAEATAEGEVVSAYGAAVVAAERVRILSRLLDVSRQAAEIYERRMEAGDAIARDVSMALLDLGRTHALLAEANGRLTTSLARLLRATGERYDRVESTDFTPPAFDVDDYLAKLEKGSLPAVAIMEAQARYYEHQKHRLKREGVNPFQLMVNGGRGDFGETRLGVGVAYEIPVFRRRQGERAFAEAESQRAEIEGDIREAYIKARIEGIVEQLLQDQEAFQVLTEVALPAADKAVEAAMATAVGGKDDAFVVIFSRRERVLMAVQRLDIAERQWLLLGELIQLTGEVP